MNDWIEPGCASRLSRIRFSVSRPGGDRVHYINADDVQVVLGRLPVELWERLRAVHFNDRSRGGKVAGYVTPGHSEIALCALPPRISLLGAGLPAEIFGARRNRKWPPLAVRRFMLYQVLLHEIGHLQVIDPKRKSERLRFGREKLADRFAKKWRQWLWTVPFDHPDPVHNPPGPEEQISNLQFF